MDIHEDCERQLNEAEDRIIMLNKVIGDLNGRIKELEEGTLQVVADSNKLQLEAAERIKELEELLIEYGRHSSGCSAQYSKKYGCRCGWDREKKILKG